MTKISRNMVHILSLVIGLFLVTALVQSCGGGGGSDNTTTADDSSLEDNLPEFLTGQLIAQKNAIIRASDGGSVELNGASLTVPADALSEDVRLGLATVSLTVNDLPPVDGARLGLKVVSPEAYLLFSETDVDLDQPLTLRLPIDPNLLPDNISEQDIQLSSQMGGFLVPFGSPTRVDLENNFVELEIDIPTLLAYGADQIMTESPRAFGSVGFLTVMAGLATTPWTWNAILVTINDIEQIAAGRTMTKRSTPHFTIFIDENQNFISLQEVIAIENVLEIAYQVFVEDMGMGLPNLINLDGRYSVVIDDLGKYSVIPLPENTPDGFTLAGSSLIEGISYINTTIPLNQMKNVAVHEYFHALQWGALSSPLIWNIGDKKLDLQTAAQAGWMFEGSATALAGRIIEGNIVNPARDSGFNKRMPQGVSLFASEKEYGMAHDVAQDFFFYLERHFGEFDFYPDMFANISPSYSPLNIFDNRESAVRAADIVIQDLTGGNMGMEETWENFVVDYWVDNTGLYSQQFSFDGYNLDKQGAVQTFNYNMPALSQRVFSLTIPALEKDTQGKILPNQATDVEINVSMTTNDGSIRQVPVLIVDELKATAAERFPWFASSFAPRTKEYINYRTENERQLFFVMSYPELSTSASANLSFEARLIKVDNKFEASVNIPGVNVSFQADFFSAFTTLWFSQQQTVAIVAAEGNTADSESISITSNPNIVTGTGTYSISSDLDNTAAIFLFTSPTLKHATNIGTSLGGTNVAFSALAGSLTITSWGTNVGDIISGSFSTQVSGVQVTGIDDEDDFTTKDYNGTITGSFSVEVIATN